MAHNLHASVCGGTHTRSRTNSMCTVSETRAVSYIVCVVRFINLYGSNFGLKHGIKMLRSESDLLSTPLMKNKSVSYLNVEKGVSVFVVNPDKAIKFFFKEITI